MSRTASPRSARKRRLRIAGATLLGLGGVSFLGGVISLGHHLDSGVGRGAYCGYGGECANDPKPPQRALDEGYAGAGLLAGAVLTGAIGAIFLSASFSK